jgi:hypothetical protein
MLTQLQHRTSF